ncbi:Hydrophobin-3 [Pseudolycoriella hygida]|uniref:Hydrophobin-3 n=1 Tax=Pseudolycoriella hygida TaxID=35572 RepID=A0A9Q0RUL8_9DIPT|nr:Hydrophobin-3 [Pseudolycoriella hygida]
MKAVAIFVIFCAIHSAIGTGGGGGSGNINCQTGKAQCCNSVQQHNSPLAILTALLGGINLNQLIGVVGIQCLPVGVIGASGTVCASQAACCTGNSFDGLIVLGCSPVAIGG